MRSFSKISRSSLSFALIPRVPSTTRTATSTRLSVSFVFATRNVPSSPSSSKPGVSITTTGPMGEISIALRTGSVVVPGVSEITDRFCPVTAFTTLDFPAFRMPKNPICTRSEDGASLIMPMVLSSHFRMHRHFKYCLFIVCSHVSFTGYPACHPLRPSQNNPETLSCTGALNMPVQEGDGIPSLPEERICT